MKRLFLSTNRQQEIYSCADLSPENIDKLINFEPINGDIILIDGKNNPDHGIEMLLYFIFDTCQKASIFEARFKIVLIGDRALEVYLRDYPESSPLFHIGVNYFFDRYKSKPEDITDCIDNFISFDFSLLEKNIDRGYVQISPPPISRHQLTNEWGAYKLAHTADLTYLLGEIESLKSELKRPYFSFLKCKHKIYPTNEPLKELNLPIDNASFLLIDDNYDKGWSLVFEHILAQESVGRFQLKVHTDFQNLKVREEDIITAVLDQIRSDDICGVLLDLRLNRDEEELPEFDHTNIQKFSGSRILTAIKNAYPCLPVVMITASNKVWNAEQLRQAGADGFFVKEDPTILISPEVSKSNYKAFEKLLKDCYEKQEKLNKFWKYIKEIEIGNYIEEKIINAGATKIEERIKERLRMFVGLLKRGHEDTSFNQDHFNYSDIELAFLSLWSCLIEIQFSYYDKTNSSIDINTALVSRLGLTEITFFNKLVPPIPIGSKTMTHECHVKLDRDSYILANERSTNDTRKGMIGHQIAFLILSLSKSAPTIIQSDIDKLLENLEKTKFKRNKLYLTHGSEKETDDFFIKTVQEQKGQRVTLTDCKRLFEIIYFLLKVEIIDMGA